MSFNSNLLKMANKTHIEYEEIVEKNCRNAIKRLVDNNPLLSEEQKNTLYLYQDFLESKQIQIYTSVRGRERQLRALTSYQSTLTYIREIVNFGEFIEKKFEEAKREDVDNYRTYLKRHSSEERARRKEEKKFALSKVKIKRNPLARKDNTNETFISQYAIEMYSNLIKRFYLWLYNRDNLFKGEVPHLVAHLQKRKDQAPQKRILPSEVLTTEEIGSLIKVADNTRDKAYTSILYESAVRCGELTGANISHFEDCGNYGFLQVIDEASKTVARRIVLIHSLPHLRKWLNDHPYKNDRDAPLFVGFSHHNRYGRLSKRGGADILKKCAKRIGLKKKHNPHHFRHSRLDYAYRTEKLNERDLRYLAGWCEDTNMHKVYIHYGNDEVNLKILDANGIKVETNHKKDYALKKKKCIICEQRFPNRPDLFEFPAESKFCVTCGAILDANEAQKILKLKQEEQNIMEFLLNPKILNNIDSSKGLAEGIMDKIMDNPLLREKYEKIHFENDFDKLPIKEEEKISV